jgi:hypothetical protein
MGNEVTEFVWHVELSISNEYGELQLGQSNGSGSVSGPFTEDDVEASSIAWALDHIDPDLDPRMVQIVSFTWSSAQFEGSH